MNKILSQIPRLEDHAPYESCMHCIAELEQKLAEARGELLSLGSGPLPTVEPDGDLDAAVVEHFKLLEKHAKLRVRAGLKVEMLEGALRGEKEQIPELRRQAEDFVGGAAAKLHQEVVARLVTLKSQMSDALTLEAAIRYRVRTEINRRTLGHGPWRLEERYCWAPAICSPVAAPDHVLPKLVDEALGTGKTDA